jgi:hypothetical protein
MARKQNPSWMSSDKIMSDLTDEYLLVNRNWQPREMNLWLAHAMDHGLHESLGHQAKRRLHHWLAPLVVRALKKLNVFWRGCDLRRQ